MEIQGKYTNGTIILERPLPYPDGCSVQMEIGEEIDGRTQVTIRPVLGEEDVEDWDAQRQFLEAEREAEVLRQARQWRDAGIPLAPEVESLLRRDEEIKAGAA